MSFLLLIQRIRTAIKISKLKKTGKRGSANNKQNIKKHIGKLKTRNRVLEALLGMNVLVIIIFVVFMITSAVVAGLILTSVSSYVTQVAYEDETTTAQPETTKKNSSDGTDSSDYTEIVRDINGLNRSLQNWYDYFKYIEAVNKIYSSKDLPPWIFVATTVSESGGTVCSYLNDSSFNINTDLVELNPVCGGKECRAGLSTAQHFSGTVNKSAKEPYSIYFGIPDTTKYTDSSGNKISHAIGPLQFETVWLANRHMKFGQAKVVDYELDSNLGFVRPNFWYLPDCIQMAFNLYGTSSVDSELKDRLSRLLTSSGYKELTELNRQFINGVLARCVYNRGSIYGNTIKFCEEAIELNKESKLNNMYDIFGDYREVFWDSADMKYNSSFTSDKFEAVKKKYGFTVPTKATETDSSGAFVDMPYNYVASMCAAYYCWTDVNKQIANAAKETTSDGKIGLSDSSYYWFYQQHSTSDYKETKTTDTTSGYIGMSLWGQGNEYSYLGQDGCGIYAMSEIVSNLLGKQITPIQLLTDIGSKATKKSDGTYIIDVSDSGCFTNGVNMYFQKFVDKVCNTYGLKQKLVNNSSDMVTSLKSGYYGFGWFFGHDNNFSWYNGEADMHFMMVRYIDKKGLIYCLTSWGRDTGSFTQSGASMMEAIKQTLNTGETPSNVWAHLRTISGGKMMWMITK